MYNLKIMSSFSSSTISIEKDSLSRYNIFVVDRSKPNKHNFQALIAVMYVYFRADRSAAYTCRFWFSL